MFLTKLALRRPVSLLLLLVTLGVFGISSIFGFKMSYQPEIEMPTYLVLTPYIGAEPEIIDSTVSTQVEKIGANLSGFTESTCISEENMSTVIFMFDYDIDKNQTYLDLKTEVDQLELPSDASTPIIMQFAFNTSAMMSIAVTSQGEEDALSFAENTVVPQIETLMGVADVEVYGGQESYVRIVADPTKMKQYGLSMASLGNAIAMYDFEMPLGSLTQGSQDISVSSGTELTSLAQLQEVAVSTASGEQITLGEVAQVMMGVKDAESISRYNGEETINLEIINVQDANIPDVADQVNKQLEILRAQNPNFTIEVTNDDSEMILTTLLSVVDTLMIGVVLCMLVLFIFLGNIRASLIVGSSIPISLVITLICMSVADFELNMITSSALVIAIGLMVDNAIVVLESIFKVKEQLASQEMSPQERFSRVAYEGCSVVGTSVVASTITTIVVYLPLTTLGGVSGQMFVQLSFTIVFAMLASLFSATVLVPMFYFLLKPEEKRSKVTILMEKLEGIYVKLVPQVLKKKFAVVALAVALLIGSFALLLAIPLELLPETDSGKLLITANFRPNSQLEDISQAMLPIEAMIQEDHRLDGYMLSIEGNTAHITAYTADGFATKPMVDEYLLATMAMPNMAVDVAASGDEFMTSMVGDMTLITTTLWGYEYNDVYQRSLEVQEKLYEIPGVNRISSSSGDWGSAKAEITILPKKALDFGTSAVNVAQTLRLAVSGMEAATMDIAMEEYDIIIEYPSGYADDLHLLMELPIDTPMGQIPLSQMAELTFKDSPQSIKKLNGFYCIDLTISPVPGANSQVSAALDQMEIQESTDLVQMGFGPGKDYMTEEVTAMVMSNLTAGFLVFMVMAMQFQSIRFSLMVMNSVAFSFIGSFGLLFLSGEPLTTVALMGVMMLTGIVVNNGILFVDTANMLRQELPLEEALVESGRIRMRPIIMTTMTTVLSMVPLALAIGEGTEMMQSMGIIIIGGLLASTVLVLFLMPTLYLIIDKKDKTDKGEGTPPSPEEGPKEISEEKTEENSPENSENPKEPAVLAE